MDRRLKYILGLAFLIWVFWLYSGHWYYLITLILIFRLLLFWYVYSFSPSFAWVWFADGFSCCTFANLDCLFFYLFFQLFRSVFALFFIKLLNHLLQHTNINLFQNLTLILRTPLFLFLFNLLLMILLKFKYIFE